ncbi:MAG: AMP-binding protein [Gammaproteobacteria bacterium]|nr:AMP-binding protein [Gammaproteobacteria bacterium]
MDSLDNFQAVPALPVCGSLRDIIGEACKKYADLTAFSCEGAHLSFKKLDRLSDQFAAWLLRESTLEPGDRVAIQLPNLLQYPVVALGVIKAGMVIVNINPLYTAGETEHQLRDSGARALVVLEDVLPVISRILPGTAIDKVVVTGAADLHHWSARWAYNLKRFLKRRKHKTIRFAAKVELRDVVESWKRHLRVHNLAELNPAAFQTHESPVLGVVQYTGGTTGVAKGAMLSHDNLIANMLQIDHVIDGHNPDPGEVFAAPLPFYHIYAFTLNFLYSLYRGYHGILIPDPRNTDKVVRAISRVKLGGFIGVSTLFQMLCKHPKFQQLDFSRLTLCTAGGMALSVSTARRWEKLTGCRILEGYGLTETSPLVASSTIDDYHEEKIGKPTLWTELKVLNDKGDPVPHGEEGEVLVRGPQVMMGYWNRPEETREVLGEDGWLHTGDIGMLDEEGNLTIVDRIKDLILVSGFNVYPAEIEDHILKHPDIREAAVIGIPREGDSEGEQVKLFVISDNPELSVDEVIAFCRQGLAGYKVPSKVEFRATLPRANVGKILRRQLRDDQAV